MPLAPGNVSPPTRLTNRTDLASVSGPRERPEQIPSHVGAAGEGLRRLHVMSPKITAACRRHGRHPIRQSLRFDVMP
jgi:hypothetical protein